tara:strand:- start:141 stop:269 length:129 start_codon:yes stop_codon:yes gene_type:complete
MMVVGRKLNQTQIPLVIKIKTWKAVLKMMGARKIQMNHGEYF